MGPSEAHITSGGRLASNELSIKPRVAVDDDLSPTRPRWFRRCCFLQSVRVLVAGLLNVDPSWEVGTSLGPYPMREFVVAGRVCVGPIVSRFATLLTVHRHAFYAD